MGVFVFSKYSNHHFIIWKNNENSPTWLGKIYSSCFIWVRLVAVFVEELIDTLGVAPRGSSHRLETCFMRQCWKYVFGFLDIFGSFKIYTIFWPYAADFPKSKVTSSKKNNWFVSCFGTSLRFLKKKTPNKKQLHSQPFWIAPRVPQKKIANTNAPGSGSVTTVFFNGFSPSPWAIPMAESAAPLLGAEGPNDISGLNFSSRLG